MIIKYDCDWERWFTLWKVKQSGCNRYVGALDLIWKWFVAPVARVVGASASCLIMVSSADTVRLIMTQSVVIMCSTIYHFWENSTFPWILWIFFLCQLFSLLKRVKKRFLGLLPTLVPPQGLTVLVQGKKINPYLSTLNP